MQRLIIDTDPGIDDAMAIHYAFADPRIKVLGLTSVLLVVLLMVFTYDD